MTTETVQGAALEKLVTAEKSSAPPQDSSAPAPDAQKAPAPVPPPEKPADKPADPASALAATAEQPKGTPAYPDDWRERAARGDAKKLAKLSRYSSPEAVADALISAQDKISSQGLRESVPQDPEALARWRSENGIPDAPEKYDLKLKDGLTLGEVDKELIGDFLKTAHAKNVHPEVVNAFADWYFGKQEEAMSQFALNDQHMKQEAEKALIAEWGNNYVVERNGIKSFLETQGLTDLQFARLPDGSTVGTNVDMLRKLSALARDINPGGTVVPGASNASASIEQEMAAIERTMGTTQYTNDAGKQARYLELLQAKEKINSRR